MPTWPDQMPVAGTQVGLEHPRLTGAPGLTVLIGEQLDALSHWAGLAHGTSDRLRKVFTLLTRESLDRPASPPFRGLSCINANGLPFQWVLRFSDQSPGFGFLCEIGAPGETAHQRYAQSLERLNSACELLAVPRPLWIGKVCAQLIPAENDAWPAHWRSAMWMGVAASQVGIQLKPYFNLNRGSARERWLRVGWILRDLGREHSLQRLCELSRAASSGSWPVGLTVDVLPNGSPGRMKVYFRSESVPPGWLERWYTAAGFAAQIPSLRRCLDTFPRLGKSAYPPAAFILSIEFHAHEKLGIKTDLAVTKWQDTDRQMIDGARSLVDWVGGKPAEVEQALEALGAWPTKPSAPGIVRFVSLGSEPDGSQHVNLYLEPPLSPPPGRRCAVSLVQPPTVDAAIHRGLQALQSKHAEGHWTDFSLPVGNSDAWVTAYVLARLADVPDRFLTAPLRRMVADALAWLLTQRTPNGGWGYNRLAGDDADSTSWAIIALQRQGHPVPPSAFAAIHRCLCPAGGVGTYPEGAIAGQGWTQSVPDVTALAFQALSLFGESARAVFSRWPRLNGLLPAYWWASPLYTTAALLDCSVESGLPTILQAQHESLTRFVPTNAFDEALWLRCLLKIGHPSARAAARRLVDRQQEDGSWPAAAFLRLTSPEVTEPWNVMDPGPIYHDRQRVFTTATAVSALGLSRNFQSLRKCGQ